MKYDVQTNAFLNVAPNVLLSEDDVHFLRIVDPENPALRKYDELDDR